MLRVLTLIAVIALASCGAESGETSTEKNNTDTTQATPDTGSAEVERQLPKVEIDEYLTNTANLIAGKPLINEDSAFVAVQNMDVYAEYKQFVDDAFKNVRETMLTPIKTWKLSKGVGDDREGTTCFYPLSGPDFLFGHTFYPNSDNYILMGLERKGTVLDVPELDENRAHRYFKGLKESMGYLRTRGYFVTQYMSRDFSRSDLDGVSHMIMLMMARTQHKIVDVYYLALEEGGSHKRYDKLSETPDDKVIVLTIEFTDQHQETLKKCHYISYDVSDQGMEKHPELEEFLYSFDDRLAYMKSASCVLFNTDFEKMRQLVLSCDKIIQDDTGVPYRYFKDGNYDVTLYGTYTSVISDLNWCMQNDLKRDILESPENKDLPFKISYNGNYGKGMLLYAVNREQKTENSESGVGSDE